VLLAAFRKIVAPADFTLGRTTAETRHTRPGPKGYPAGHPEPEFPSPKFPERKRWARRSALMQWFLPRLYWTIRSNPPALNWPATSARTISMNSCFSDVHCRLCSWVEVGQNPRVASQNAPSIGKCFMSARATPFGEHRDSTHRPNRDRERPVRRIPPSARRIH
jgi:hypothetical protein